jgi:hypothetical protein
MRLIMYLADDVGIKDIDVMVQDMQSKYRHLYTDFGVELEEKDKQLVIKALKDLF